VRVNRRVAQPRCDQLLELLGEHVLEHLGLGVHAIPRHPELLREEQLEQAVMPQHLQRHTPALLGQPHTVIGLVLDDPDLGQLAHHPRHRPGRHPEPRRQIVRRDRRSAASLERIHRLRIVLHRRRKKRLRRHTDKNVACLILHVKCAETIEGLLGID
jgi:hypothetical protein